VQSTWFENTQLVLSIHLRFQAETSERTLKKLRDHTNLIEFMRKK